jgi:hypothetical protein
MDEDKINAQIEAELAAEVAKRRAAKPSVRSCAFTSVFYGRFGPP